MEKKLPKYFVIKEDEKNPLWKKYIDWLNETYHYRWSGVGYMYFVLDGNVSMMGGVNAHYNIKNFQNNPTLLTLKEWDEIVNPKILKVGDEVNLHGLVHSVIHGSNVYFLNNELGLNDACFNKLNIDKNKFTESVLGYCNHGDFPNCNSLEDLTKLVNALKNYKPEQKQDNNMEKITIPEDLFIEGQKAMSKDRLAWFKQNVDPWTRQTTKWFITEYYNREACSGWKEKIEKAFPFVKEDDKSVYFKKGSAVCASDGDCIITIRIANELKDKALVLDDSYNWEIKRDSDNFLCLVPTKK